MLTAPRFGSPEPGVDYRHRPGAYAVIIDGGCIAMADVEGVLHLPGGGLEPGEDHAAALVREVAEETGLRVEIEAWFAEAEEYAWSRDLGHFIKAGRFARARVVGHDRDHTREGDHRLVWLRPDEVRPRIVGPSQWWAIERALDKLD